MRSQTSAPTMQATATRQAGLFIVGTDTEVGKTHQCALLARKLARSMRVGVYKPVQSGVASGAVSDAEILFEAAGLHGDAAYSLERVCPQSFRAALAPPMAAQMECKQVDEALLVEGALWWRERCDFLIVESAGGGLSPISGSLTSLDLAVELQLPIVVVAANRLGVVSHTLMSMEAIEARGLELRAVVLNTLPGADESAASNLQLLQDFAPGIDFLESLDLLELPQRDVETHV